MDKDKIKAQILEKFDSVSRFAKLAKLDRYALQKFFARKYNSDKETARISHLVEVTKNKASDGEITPVQIEALSKALKKAGGVIAFSSKYKRFSEKSLYQILDGRRKRITPKVQKLFDYFELR